MEEKKPQCITGFRAEGSVDKWGFIVKEQSRGQCIGNS